MPVSNLHSTVHFTLEFLIFLLPQVVFFAAPFLDLPLLLVMVLVALCLSWSRCKDEVVDSEVEGPLLESTKMTEKRLGMITNLRSTVMIITVMAILAVDFANFPRRYYKTVRYGTSLMDVGIGCIIYVSGLVVSERNQPSLKLAFQASLPMLVIGVARVLLVRLLLGGGHDAEYGRHWNFFVSLGLLTYLSTLARMLVPLAWMLPAGLLLSVGYEVVLKVAPLESYLMDTTERIHGVIDGNKAGLFGLIGSLALFMVSVGVTQQVRRLQADRRFLARHLATISMASWGAYYALKYYLGLEASRRLMNLQFTLWISSLTTTHMSLYLIADILAPRQAGHAALFEAINQNMLSVFLACNLATGLVNIIMDTKAASTLIAFLVLTAYALFFGAGAFYLKLFNVTIRFK